jgi:hypothetical protein
MRRESVFPPPRVPSNNTSKTGVEDKNASCDPGIGLQTTFFGYDFVSVCMVNVLSLA